MKKVPDLDPAGQKAPDPTGPGSSSLGELYIKGEQRKSIEKVYHILSELEVKKAVEKICAYFLLSQ